METVRSSFHAQLVTVMDSLLSAAVSEIAKIFESSLCEQHAQLVQKAEEISILRAWLEDVGKRQKAEGDEQTVGDTVGSGSHKIPKGPGLRSEKEGSSHLAATAILTRLKEEEVSHHDVRSVKEEMEEFAASQLTSISVTVKTSTEHLSSGDAFVTQAESKMPLWDQSSHQTDNRPLNDQDPSPFQSLSPKHDPGSAHTGEGLPGLDPASGCVSSLENIHTKITTSTGSVDSSAAANTPCFQADFGSDEKHKEEDQKCSLLDQNHENKNSTENLVKDHSVGRGDPQQVEPQTQSDESLWSHRDDTGGKGNGSLIRRVLNFDIREPQTQVYTHRHANNLNLSPSNGGKGRPYSCPYCNMCFTYPSHQRRHLLRHTGVRPHPCQFCEKSFLTLSELTVHIRTHTGERPYGCAQCGKRFGRNGNLKAHQRDVHMGRRPYTCTECGKKFAHRGNLRVHNHRVHQGDPDYMDVHPEPDPNPIGRD